MRVHVLLSLPGANKSSFFFEDVLGAGVGVVVVVVVVVVGVGGGVLVGADEDEGVLGAGVESRFRLRDDMA